MDLEHYTVTLLTLREDAPVLDDEAAGKLQDAHMAHLADLYETGDLVAAGPLLDGRFRGLTIFRVDAARALELEAADPAVQAGRLSVQVMPWLVPGGLLEFTRGRLPRSMSDLG